MQNQSYGTSIEVAADPADVFDHINNVPKWFKNKGFEGNSTKLNDEFIFCYGDREHAHYSKQKLVEFLPGKKVVWLVTDSKINWIENNKEEWTNTKIVFEISTEGDKTLLHFTHEGLLPELECYADCEQGWNIIIKEWLFNFITDGAWKSNI
jgi:hypothetical protein